MATKSEENNAAAVETPEKPPVENEAQAVAIPRVLTVKELGDLLGLSPVEVIKDLMKNGVMATINQNIDFDTAAIVAHDLGFEPEQAKSQGEEEAASAAESDAAEQEDESALQPRPPVVTVLGHVDHGKTSLLDAIRNTDVIAGEAGGITQHIGAYQVEVNGQHISFLDTPGHEAFTAMRARGAQITDIAVLVIAADDGIMPQTREAIDHARAADVPIVVAITKVDLPDANADRVKQQLAEQGLNVEEYGGDVICVSVSAKTGEGVEQLLENILVAAEVLELKANPERAVTGTVIEAEMDRKRGPTATVLVQAGTLRVGDVAVVERTWGRTKAMFNEHGKRVKSAGPGEPVAVLGLDQVPAAGDTFQVVENDKAARQIVFQRLREHEAASFRIQPHVTLDTLYGAISEGKVKQLSLILKTDVQGSIEPIRQALEELSTGEVRVKIIHSSSGTVSESDVMLAIASEGIIIAFNTPSEPGADLLIAKEGVDLRSYRVIYNITEDVEKALQGMLDPIYKDVVTAHAEVRQVFQQRRRSRVAGAYLRDGTMAATDSIRLLRDGELVLDTKITSLRRFQEDVREVQTGFEFGVMLEGVTEFHEGDELEAYRRERER